MRKNGHIDWGPNVNWDLTAYKRRPMTELERQRKHRKSARDISDDFRKACESIDWPRRRRALSDPMVFIREYCMGDGAIFDYCPFEETKKIIDVMLAASGANVPYHIRLTRGGGKTTLMIWLAVFLLCRHEKNFIVLTAAKLDNATPMVNDIWNLFENNDALAQDFPEYSCPILALEGSRQRAPSQTFNGKPTLIRKSDKVIRFPTLAGGCPLLRNSTGGAIVMANGFDGKTRGLRIGSRRPDFILLDDLQDEDMAKSSEMVEKARDKIYKTYMKLGSATEKPAILMTSTAIEPGDLSETIAADPNWKTETFPMLLRMPDKSTMELWKEYKRLRDDDITYLRFDEHSETKFYMENREKMDKGAIPLWKECYYHDGTEISAIQHAMNLFLEDEESFLSEYQMQPKRADLALDVPRSIIPTRVLTGYARRVIPPGYVYVAAATDINPSYALTTTIVAFKPDRTAHVIDHIISPITIDGKLNDSDFNRLVYSALMNHGRALATIGVKIHAWGIDASGRQFTAVPAFAKTCAANPEIRIPACAMMGRAQIRFNPFVRSRLRDAINSTVECGDDAERAGVQAGRIGSGSRWITWDADRYKEAVQRALLTEVGGPGGCTLYDGGQHTDFAIQVTNERLQGKRPHGDGRDEYVWQSADPHDYLDCMAMCYAIAASQGIAGGIPNLMRRVPVKRKPKFVIR